jgi:hypothetical protein
MKAVSLIRAEVALRRGGFLKGLSRKTFAIGIYFAIRMQSTEVYRTELALRKA